MYSSHPVLATSVRQDLFSTAYVEAIAATAGYNWTFFVRDTNKVDIGFEHKTGKNALPAYPRLRVQIKCTYDDDSRPKQDGYVHFRLDADTYEDLRNAGEPHILVVLIVPSEMKGCLEFSENAMLLKERAYWYSLRHEPELPYGQSSRTIKIPVNQQFTVGTLSQLMQDIWDGKKP